MTAASNIRALLFDMDGVLYNSEMPIEGAAGALDWVRKRGIPHLFVTNTTSRPRAALAEKLARFGIPASAERIFTPPAAASAWLRAHGGKTALFVPAQTKAEFQRIDLLAEDAEAGADFVVIGDLGEAWDFATLNRAFRLLHANPQAQLIALGGTKFWQGPTGLQLDVAPFTAALECATGRKALLFGKPSPEFFAAALERLGTAGGQTLMIGDDIEADVGGAQRAGLQAALVETGKFRTGQHMGGVVPDLILASIADLPEILGP